MCANMSSIKRAFSLINSYVSVLGCLKMGAGTDAS